MNWLTKLLRFIFAKTKEIEVTEENAEVMLTKDGVRTIIPRDTDIPRMIKNADGTTSIKYYRKVKEDVDGLK